MRDYKKFEGQLVKDHEVEERPFQGPVCGGP